MQITTFITTAGIYARFYLDGTMQKWVDAEDSLEVW